MRVFYKFIAAILLLASGLLAWLLWLRLKLPYDREGRYFDEESIVVYHEQSIMAYGMLLAIGLMLSFLFSYFGLSSYKGTSSP